MGTVIAITSGKGGTGKTSVTGAVAVALALRGRNVLCMDMDVGLRNLDITLGMSDRALMDFCDVVLGRCELDRAVSTHPAIAGLSLLSAPMSLPAGVDEGRMRDLLMQARSRYDYVLLDSPAGLGPGFRLALAGADRALVVSTSDASSIRDAQRTVTEMEQISVIHLVMNRIQPRLLRKLRTTIDDAMNSAGLPLIGVIPEDPRVLLCANQGIPLTVGGRRGAALACQNIARRLEGERVPVMHLR